MIDGFGHKSYIDTQIIYWVVDDSHDVIEFTGTYQLMLSRLDNLNSEMGYEMSRYATCQAQNQSAMVFSYWGAQ